LTNFQGATFERYDFLIEPKAGAVNLP